jgi:outer membrane protein OmpA-like peptidoglycan-associated protein/tetratricopeptide (TPR) repeat protein
MSRYLLVLILIILCCRPLQAQELTNIHTQADRLFDRAEYYKSLDLYLKLSEQNNTLVTVIERIADCYRLMNNYQQAEQWYARLATTQGIKPIDILYYAEVLLSNKKFDKAKEQYKRYYASNGSKADLDFKIAACDSAALWMKSEGNYMVTNEKKINTIYADWGVSYLGKTNIIFTSDRSTNNSLHPKAIYNRTGNEWLKLFNYDLQNATIAPVDFDKTGSINLTKDYHTGPMATNAAGDTAYITVTTRLGKGSLSDIHTKYDNKLYIRRLELIMATKVNGKWWHFTRFPYDNVAAYSIGHAALSKNGSILYFTSDMPGGQGGTDIWYSKKKADGKWDKPVNCGKTINTAAEEAFPSIGGDGKLYFSSRGLPGMGGYDIFSSTGAEANWTQPVNLKSPINSTNDDFCFITNDGLNGYLSSDRQGGQGSDDIYSFKYIGTEDRKKKESKDKTTTDAPIIAAALPGEGMSGIPVLLKGGVYDNSNGKSLDSVQVLVKNAAGENIDGAMVLSNRNFAFRLLSGQDYTIEASKKGFYTVTEHISAKDFTVKGLDKDLKLMMEHLEIGKTFVIRTIYYNLNRAGLRPDAVAELDKLVAIMRENPSMKIELSSHTDSRGSDYYNMLLSEARAVSAVAYLKNHGIAEDRMIAKGYGETKLLNKCANGVNCSEAEHQFNRRTEIKVIGGDFK